MRIAFLSTFDSRGGAARAAFRLFSGVSRHTGIETVFVVREKRTGHPRVVEDHSRLTTLWGDRTTAYDLQGLRRHHPDRMIGPYSVNRLLDSVHETVLKSCPDLVHLHWPHAGFLRIESLLRLGLPIIWTIHDMWAFTGVCHYSDGCQRYQDGCGLCPLLGSREREDISARTFFRKSKVYPRLDLSIVSPSQWLADMARGSLLLREREIAVIPNGLDMRVFRPFNRHFARLRLGLPSDEKLLLIGADHALSDRRKGCIDLLRVIADSGSSIRGVLFGNDSPLPEELPVISVGRIDDDQTLAMLYSACDLYAFPSRQDNLPNTIIEAMACGLPVVAFAVGGIPEIIEHGKSGFLVRSTDLDMEKFLTAVLGALEMGDLREMSGHARESAVRKYEIGRISGKYAELYREALEERQ